MQAETNIIGAGHGQTLAWICLKYMCYSCFSDQYNASARVGENSKSESSSFFVSVYVCNIFCSVSYG